MLSQSLFGGQVDKGESGSPFCWYAQPRNVPARLEARGLATDPLPQKYRARASYLEPAGELVARAHRGSSRARPAGRAR